ncbi:MAG TPA: tRNA pseudouridine synthase A [Phycisphaerales bacterium]|nr:tRNA pseudouridine synthase A [Phycisphaerales bacterium]
MPRYRLTIAYDGTDFCGWQKQFPHADAVPGALTRFHDDDPPVFEFPGVLPAAIEGAPGEHTADAASAHAENPDPRPRAELRTVQSVVERAVRLTVRQPVVVMGASRTDSGVHARGQVCAFSTFDVPGAQPASGGPTVRIETRQPGVDPAPPTNFERFGGGWPAERGAAALVRALNARLPDDVLVRTADVVPPDFDPISGAISKAYSYSIFSSRQRPLWERRQSLHVWHELDAERMRRAAALFVGEHDFAAFAAAGHARQSTVRTVFSCTVRERELPDLLDGEVGGRLITIDIAGSGFLWNMVRIISGTLVEAGKGAIGEDRIREALRSGDRRLAGPTLPPQGLCLEWIRYADAPRA